MPDSYAFVFTIKQGARKPALLLQLLGDDGAAVDLTNATSATLVTEPHGGGTAVSYSMSFVSRALGKVQYSPSAAFTTTAGNLDAEVDVLWDDGLTETYPTVGKGLIVVEAQIS
jgi:hypothetical protein